MNYFPLEFLTFVITVGACFALFASAFLLYYRLVLVTNGEEAASLRKEAKVAILGVVAILVLWIVLNYFVNPALLKTSIVL